MSGFIETVALLGLGVVAWGKIMVALMGLGLMIGICLYMHKQLNQGQRGLV